MESKKTSETLEHGFVESKPSQTENPCDKFLEQADSIFLCNLSEKCTTDVYSDHCEVSHVELVRKLGNGSVKESMLLDGIAGNDQINKGSLGRYPDNKLSVLMNGNEINNNDVPVLEGDLKFSGNDGIQIGKVEQPVEKSDAVLHSREPVQVEKVDEPMEEGHHVLHPHEPGSPTKLEVSGNGINLFVEVFGPLDGISESNNNLNDTGERMLGESDSNQEYSPEENATLSPDVKNVSAKNEEEDIVGEQECTFDVGDLVWVKTRTQLWWPGMVSDPSNAANDATKSEKRGSFLVKYFGNANFVWCDNSDLKPFLEYFEQMSGQNNSRSFFGSVERALCEIGQRVKSKMTCPCFSKDSETLAAQWSMDRTEENSMSMDKRSKSDVLSLSQFEPAAFLACVRHVACSVYVPGKLELTVMKNCLSSFYCSIGHCELPLPLLRSGSDAAQNAQDGLTSEVIDEGHSSISGGSRHSARSRDGDLTVSRREKRNHSDDADLVLGDKIASSGKGSESRERKKSKYLSYPYVDVNQGLNVVTNSGQETEDLNPHSSLSTKSTPLVSFSGMNSRKRGSRKSFKGHHIVSKADNINSCSAELLAELCSTACDCFYLSRSKYSDSLMRFYRSFRIFAFLDADIACKDAGGLQAPNLEKCLPQNSTEAEVQMEGIRVLKESENQRVNLASVKESVDNVVGDKVLKTDNPQAKGNVIHRRAKKKKEQVISAGPESIKNSFSMGTGIYPNSSWVISFQQTCSDVPKSRTPQKSEEATPGLPHIDSISRLPDLNGIHPSFSVEHIPVGGPSADLGKPLPEQRKEGLVSPNINGFDQMVFPSVPSSKDVPVTLKDILQLNKGVNGTNQCWNEDFTTRELESNVINTGLSSFVQQSLQMGIFPSAGKPEHKKRKRKEKTCQVASVIPDLNGNMLDMSALGKTLPDGNHISPEGKPLQKRRRNKSGCTESGSNVNINNGEALGGSLLLNFAPGFSMPSKEMLVATFSRFGLLKESEIQVLNDSSVQIVYERSSEARFAFRSLEKSNTFGESLASFKLHCMPAASRTIERKNNLQMLQPFVPVDACKNPAKPGETPDITFIRQNVEMMKLTLEKAGNNLSSEMRTKLENEIKVFLDKISSMTGSSSS
ncbi:hypothetical protein Pfo_011153 [Paulownia fortunei]|nr:hypothetical protein Pfo_011153 [Paulownia fortunei]